MRISDWSSDVCSSDLPDFAVQVQQAYANLRTALDALGARPDQVAKLTVFVVDHDMSKLEVLTKNVKEMFGETLPAQTLIPVPKLAIDPMLFEFRSEERRGGKECVSTCRSRWSP